MRISQGFPPSFSSIPSGKDSLQMLWLITRQIWHHVLRPMCISINTMNDPQSCNLTGSNTKWDVVIDWTLNPLQGLRPECFLATLFSSNHNHPTEKMLHICKLMDQMCFLEHWGGLKRGQFCEHLNKFMNSVRALPMRFSERVNRFKWRWFEILSLHVSSFPCSSCAEDCKAS